MLIFFLVRPGMSAEIKKCELGESTFMNGTTRTGSNYSRPCSTSKNTMAAYTRDGAINTAKDKNPFLTSLKSIFNSLLFNNLK